MFCRLIKDYTNNTTKRLWHRNQVSRYQIELTKKDREETIEIAKNFRKFLIENIDSDIK